MSRMQDPFDYNSAFWNKADLVCSECGEVLLENELVEYENGIENVRDYREDVIFRKVKSHECFKDAIITAPIVEQTFKLNQWVVNENTQAKTFVDSQVLADLLNEQRAQGLNKHLVPV